MYPECKTQMKGRNLLKVRKICTNSLSFPIGGRLLYNSKGVKSVPSHLQTLKKENYHYHHKLFLQAFAIKCKQDLKIHIDLYRNTLMRLYENPR